MRLFAITAHGIAIDETPDRAEAIFAEAMAEPGPENFSSGAASDDLRRRGITMAKILVVDDEFGIGEVLREFLSDEGHRVALAINGRQGLEVAAKEPPDLVFVVNCNHPRVGSQSSVDRARIDCNAPWATTQDHCN
jgi:hypothetical protein